MPASRSVSPLTEARRSDRMAMSLGIEALAKEHGCVVGRRAGGDYPGERCIQLIIHAPGGLELTVEFDGDSPQRDVYVLSWHMNSRLTENKLSPQYWPNLNTCHFRKATDIAHGFNELRSLLGGRFADLQAGIPYQAFDATPA